MKALIIVIASLLLTQGCSFHKNEGYARNASMEFYQRMGAGNCEQIFDLAGKEFRQKHSRDQWTARCRSINQELGKLLRAEPSGSWIEPVEAPNEVVSNALALFDRGSLNGQFRWRIEGNTAHLLDAQLTVAR